MIGSKEMEKRAQLSLDMNEARKAAQAKTEFLNRFSQDTREALRDIMGNLSLTREEMDPGRRKDYLDRKPAGSPVSHDHDRRR